MIQSATMSQWVTRWNRWLSVTMMLVFGVLLTACAPIRPEGGVSYCYPTCQRFGE